MKKIQSILLVMVMLLSVMGLAGCGEEPTTEVATTEATPSTEEKAAATNEGSENPEVKLSFMMSQAKWRDVYQDMADAIQEDENITIEFQVIPDDQYFSLIKTKLSVGEVPDLLQYNTPSNNIELNCQENIEDLSNEPWISRLVNPSLLKDYDDGKIYAMPIESSSFFGPVYYNKQVFADLGISEEQPQTYEEFMNVLREIKEKSDDVVPVYMSSKDSWTTQVFTTLGFGVATVDKPEVWDQLLTNEITFSEVPEFITVLEELMMIFDEGLANENHLSATFDMAKEAVGTGEAAMMFNGEWAAVDITNKWPETELGAWIIPFDDRVMMGTGTIVQGLFVTKEGHPEEAKRFLEIWSQPKYQNMFWAANPGFPGFVDAEGGDVIPCVQELVDTYIATGNYTFQMNDQVAVASPILPELWKYYVEMTMGLLTPEEVMETWDAKYQDYMKSKEIEGF